MDVALADGARRQHGVVSREQIRALGLGDAAITRRIAAGRLHRVHRGVNAVGHTVLTRSGRWMAAVLACGPGAALSHASATALYALWRNDGFLIDVTARRTGASVPGSASTARAPRPRPRPATLTRTRLEHLLDQAEIRELTDYPALDAIARAHPGHHGATKLQATLNAYYAGDQLTRSDLEILFQDLCRTTGLPEPRINQPIQGKLVDVLFATERLIVEIAAGPSRLPHPPLHRPPAHQPSQRDRKSHPRRPRRPPRRVASTPGRCTTTSSTRSGARRARGASA